MAYKVKLFHVFVQLILAECIFFLFYLCWILLLLLQPNFSKGISKASSLLHMPFCASLYLSRLSFSWVCRFLAEKPIVAWQFKPGHISLLLKSLQIYVLVPVLILCPTDWKVSLLPGNLFRFRGRSRQIVHSTGGSEMEQETESPQRQPQVHQHS